MPGLCVLFLVRTSFGAPATHYVLPLYYISPFSTIIAYASSQFSTSQLNMIVLAARSMATLFGRQIVLSIQKKIGQGELAKRYG